MRKKFQTKVFIILTSFFIINSCGPINNGNNAPIAMAHKDLENSFGNNAIACFNPKIIDEKIYCKKIANFAHYTLTFVEPLKIENKNAKLQYKLRFNEKNQLSCIDNKSIKKDSIRIFDTNDKMAKISDLDVQIQNNENVRNLIDMVYNRHNILDEVCAKYYLYTTNDAKMMYQIKFNIVQNGKEIINENDDNKFAIFSNGTKLYFE